RVGDLVLAQQRRDPRSGEEHDRDDERGEPSVHDQGEREDRGGDEGPTAVPREDPGGPEQPGADPDPLRLLGHLGLGEPQLVADQAGDVLGEPADEVAGAGVGGVLAHGVDPPVRSFTVSVTVSVRSPAFSLAASWVWPTLPWTRGSFQVCLAFAAILP